MAGILAIGGGMILKWGLIPLYELCIIIRICKLFHWLQLLKIPLVHESVNKLNYNFMNDLFKSSENTINLESCHLKHKASMIILS